MSHDGKLVYMANQIGKFFAAQGEARAVEGIATHLKRYWDPAMRRAIIAQLRDGAAEALDPWPKRAVQQMAEAAAALPGDTDRAKIAVGFTPSETGTQ